MPRFGMASFLVGTFGGKPIGSDLVLLFIQFRSTKYDVVFSRKMKCTVMIDDGSDDDDDPTKPTKSGDEVMFLQC
jgi:hypothetical protein